MSKLDESSAARIQDDRIKTVQLQADEKADKKIDWTCMEKMK